MADTEIIRVRSTLPQQPDGGHRVAVFEQDAAHPGGEAFVAGPAIVEVARTAKVQRAINDEQIEIVSAPPSETPKGK